MLSPFKFEFIIRSDHFTLKCTTPTGTPLWGKTAPIPNFKWSHNGHEWGSRWREHRAILTIYRCFPVGVVIDVRYMCWLMVCVHFRQINARLHGLVLNSISCVCNEFLVSPPCCAGGWPHASAFPWAPAAHSNSQWPGYACIESPQQIEASNTCILHTYTHPHTHRTRHNYTPGIKNTVLCN